MVIKTSPLDVRTLKAKYGYTRAQMYHEVTNQWRMWDTNGTMEYYRYGEVTPTDFFNSLTEQGLPNSQVSRYFNVIYQFCTPEQCKKASKLKLSFRIAKDDFNIEPIVLVQIKRDFENYQAVKNKVTFSHE